MDLNNLAEPSSRNRFGGGISLCDCAHEDGWLDDRHDSFDTGNLLQPGDGLASDLSKGPGGPGIEAVIYRAHTRAIQ
jgi:hypothetical protein